MNAGADRMHTRASRHKLYHMHTRAMDAHAHVGTDSKPGTHSRFFVNACLFAPNPPLSMQQRALIWLRHHTCMCRKWCVLFAANDMYVCTAATDWHVSRTFILSDLNTVGPANASTVNIRMHRGLTVALFLSPHHARQVGTARHARAPTAPRRRRLERLAALIEPMWLHKHGGCAAVVWHPPKGRH